jgi:hypothetical protein
MRFSFPALVASVGLFLVGCGASAGKYGAGGGGGDGGAGGLTTTTTTTTHTTTGAGGTGGATSAGGSGGSSGSGTLTSCDDAGVCGNTGKGCVLCAIQGPCAAVFDACFNDKGCVAYQTCVDGCGQDSACVAGCEKATPSGKAPYDAYYQCVICDQCKASCNMVQGCAGP